MSTEAGDKLDLLIAFAARDCGNDDVEMLRCSESLIHPALH